MGEIKQIFHFYKLKATGFHFPLIYLCQYHEGILSQIFRLNILHYNVIFVIDEHASLIKLWKPYVLKGCHKNWQKVFKIKNSGCLSREPGLSFH